MVVILNTDPRCKHALEDMNNIVAQDWIDRYKPLLIELLKGVS